MFNNKKGDLRQIPGLLMISFLALVFLIAFTSPLVDFTNMAKQSDNLNCKGYSDPADGSLSYNGSYGTSTLSCTFVGLILPFLYLGVIMGIVMALLYGRSQYGQEGQQYQ